VRIIAGVVSVLVGVRLPRITRTAAEVTGVVPVARTAVAQVQMVIAIEIVARSASAAALTLEGNSIVIARVVIARIEIHDFSSGRILCESKLG
jgi:hypothetical protein